jgi:hypothetical protein
MDKYCLVIDGVIKKEPTTLPDVFKDENTGVQISGFNNLENAVLLQYGWMPVVVDDSARSEYAVYNGCKFTVEETQVVQLNKYCVLTKEEFEQREQHILTLRGI